ncbi:MAG TPA: hypothetical protein VHH36_03995 [Candidatus Thermoplasmatota archaeon]|nr:hypothetical protein [Candidatus Thermoplasmatota archaeon]
MAWSRSRRARDEASVHVLEAVLLGMILLGAAYGVASTRDTGGHQARPRVSLEALAQDALVVLAGLNESRGTLLETYLAEALHCAQDPSPSASDCDGVRSENLSLKLQSYLPPGAGYMYAISNGVQERVLYRSTLPGGETVTASTTLSPNWNTTFLQTELSCYEASMDVNLTSIPLWHGAVSVPKYVNATFGAKNASGLRVADDAWNITLPAATRAAAGMVVANVTPAAARNASFPGATSYGSCSLGGLGPALVAGLRLGSFAPVAASAPVTGEARFAYDLSALAAVPGATLISANLTVYEAVPPVIGAPGAYVPYAVVPLPAGASGVATWSVPGDALYGAHPVVLSARLQVGSVELDARRVAVLQVALPTGEVPIDAPYRAVLQVWFPDWS